MTQSRRYIVLWLLQCLATLIPCVPYNRLRPGLLARVVKQIKPFIAHRGATYSYSVLARLFANFVTVQSCLCSVLVARFDDTLFDSGVDRVYFRPQHPRGVSVVPRRHGGCAGAAARGDLHPPGDALQHAYV